MKMKNWFKSLLLFVALAGYVVSCRNDDDGF